MQYLTARSVPKRTMIKISGINISSSTSSPSRITLVANFWPEKFMHDCVMLKRDLCRNYARPKVALTRAIITARKRHGLVGRRSSHLIIFIFHVQLQDFCPSQYPAINLVSVYFDLLLSLIVHPTESPCLLPALIESSHNILR
jgi:hypothetical protein